MLAVVMQIVRWATGDEAGLRACCAATLASLAADDPGGPPTSARVLRTVFEHPNEPAQTWYVPADGADGGDGAADGDGAGGGKAVYHLQLPDREDRDRATLYLDVHPEHRRHGIGLALLRHAAQQAALDGRSLIAGEVFKDSPGDAFAQRAGAKPGLADARRMLVVGKLRPGAVAALRSRAETAAAGYSLVTWTGLTPQEYLPGLAAIFNALNDGPRDAGRDDRIYDVARIRQRVDGWAASTGNRYYAVAARHDATGELAALTRVAVDPEFPRWGQQLITAVTRPHRGHRLGLLVKAAMLEWLASAEPALERITTTNAADNQHMVAINEALGYELLEPRVVRYELPVADVLR